MRIVDGINDAFDQVADVYRLQLAVRASEREITEVPPEDAGKLVDEIVFLAEDHGRLEARDLQFTLAESMQQVFTLALAAQIQATAARLVGAERTDVQQASNTGCAAGVDYGFDEIHVITTKIAFAPFVQNPHQVYHRLLIFAQLLQVGGIDDISFEQSNAGVHQQCSIAMRSAAGHGYLPAAIGERKGELLTDKPAATEK